MNHPVSPNPLRGQNLTLNINRPTQPMNIARTFLAGALAGAFAWPAHAAPTAQSEEYLPVKKSTFVNLLDLLVQKGVIEKKDARGLVTEAEEEAKSEARKREATARQEEKAAAGAGAVGAVAAGGKDKKSINVGYVPEFVQRQIREQVRAELKNDVLKDVKQTAIQEKWAFSDMLPSWVNRLHPFIDSRIRFSPEFYDADNAPAFNWLAINNEGGISQALVKDNAFLNTTVDRMRIQQRYRVGLDADFAGGLKSQFRLTTTNFFNPVSTNQNFGNYEGNWLVAIDRAFIEYDYNDDQGTNWFSFYGGRIPNLFMSTEMVYSQMLSFSGLVGTFNYHFDEDDSAVSAYHNQPPTGRMGVNLGPQSPNSIFATLGVLPLEDLDFTAHDKYMYAAQLGADWLAYSDSRLKLGAAYYGYENVRAIRNAYDSFTYNWTAPRFLQKGNSLGAINDAQNQTTCNVGPLGAQNVCLVGLASGFQVADFTAAFDYAGFAPTHILLTADYAKNFGFSESYIKNMFGETITPETDAWMVRLDIGRPVIRRFNDWSVYTSYRYIERDAVMDAFNDPIFHQGGTDAKGWMIGAQYGLAADTWVDMRWLSSDAISGPPLSIDTLNIDLNAKF